MPLVALAVLLTAGAVLLVLWNWINSLPLTDPDKKATAQLDAIKTAAGIAVGGGGLFALYLAARRQRTQELELDQRERAQHDTRHDAEARRITDLYSKAVEQLGSDKAAVRHGGLYALERLGQDSPHNPSLRQAVVNVLCAYLRDPYDLPGDPPAPDADPAVRQEHRDRVREREVRLAAQRVLRDHLRPGDDPHHPLDTFWPDIDLDLTRATLVEFDLSECRIRTTRFDFATFAGGTQFNHTVFTGQAWFWRAVFTGYVSFARAQFDDFAQFSGVRFHGQVWFDETVFLRRPPTFHAQVRHPPTEDSTWPPGWQLTDEISELEGAKGEWRAFERIGAEDRPPQTP